MLNELNETQKIHNPDARKTRSNFFIRIKRRSSISASWGRIFGFRAGVARRGSGRRRKRFSWAKFATARDDGDRDDRIGNRPRGFHDDAHDHRRATINRILGMFLQGRRSSSFGSGSRTRSVTS